MNEQLRKYLLSLNCTVINPIMAKLGSKEVVGWYCKSSSTLRKEQHLKLIEKYIADNRIEYYLTEGADDREEFSIYINKTQ